MQGHKASLKGMISLGVVALVSASPLAAQEVAPVESTDAQPSDEIVVTAQKRTENVQDVPASVSVLGGDRLEDINAVQLADYATYVPGFNITNGGTPGQTQIILRGVTSQQTSSTVGVYIDDSPLGSSGAYANSNLFQIDLLPYDLERVEVLRGPQGTLYGASTMGGLLKYVLKSPDLNDLEVRLGGGISAIKGGDDIGWGVRGAVNLPLITDRLAIRASAFREVSPGYIDNVAGEADENEVVQTGGRVALMWQPTDDTSVKLSAMVQDIDTKGLAAVDLTPAGIPVYGDLSRRHLAPEPFKQRTEFYSATINHDFGWADLTSATSYSKTRTRQVSDITFAYGSLLPLFGFPAGSLATFELALDLKKFTQEIRLTSPTKRGQGALEWMIGLFYTHEENSNIQLGNALSPTLAMIGQFQNARIPTKFDEYAAFGNLTYHLTDRFDVTAGLRVAKNEQSFRQIVTGLLAPPIDKISGSGETVVTYSLAARYHLNDDTMIYGRIASGYRPGGANFINPPFPIPPTFDPDTLVNYEVGFKSEFLNGRALVNVSAFYIDWQDIKIVQIAGCCSVINNAKSARSKGVEFTGTLSPVDGLRLGANAAYTDSELAETDLTFSLLALEGAPLSQVPKWSGSLTADYDMDLAEDWRLSFGGGYRFVGDRLGGFPFPPSLEPRVRFQDYDVVDLHASLTYDRWTLRAYVRNLFDERAYFNNTGLGLYQTVMQPRTLGLSIDARF